MSVRKDVTILYVDDEEINIFLFERSFQSFYNVITATSGEAGLESLKNNADDIIVVISDMRMPGMNGIEFIRKAHDQYKNIAYYILTAFSYSEEIELALKEHVINEFFTKPFDIDVIKTAVDRAVEEFKKN